jgi:hypothetical protein
MKSKLFIRPPTNNQFVMNSKQRQAFVKRYGKTVDELAEEKGESVSNHHELDSFFNLLEREGYIYLKKEKVYILQDSTFTDEEQEIFNTLKNDTD